MEAIFDNTNLYNIERWFIWAMTSILER
jgi:hypothetical protein